MLNCPLGAPGFVWVHSTLKIKRRSSTVIFFLLTSFKIMEATRNLREFGVSCIGWSLRRDKNWRIKEWIRRWIVSMYFLPRTKRFPSSRPEVFQFSASLGGKKLDLNVIRDVTIPNQLSDVGWLRRKGRFTYYILFWSHCCKIDWRNFL